MDERCNMQHPHVDAETFDKMKEDFDTRAYELCVYIYPQINAGHPYLNIYFWDVKLPKNKPFRRFIVADDYRMSELDINDFIAYTRNPSLQVNKLTFCKASVDIIQRFPSWNYTYYNACLPDVGMALQHCLFASLKNGDPYEILYKAGLSSIAYYLDEINHKKGTTPESIIGAPLKLLRILNREPHIKLLFEQERFEAAKAAYRMYSGYLGKELPSREQWEYIMQLYERGCFGGCFRREIYNKASLVFVDKNRTKLYEEYFSIIKKLCVPGKIFIPELRLIHDELHNMKRIMANSLDYLLFHERKENESLKYDYLDPESGYSICMVESPLDILRTSLYFNNCLCNYIDSHACAECTILFVYKADKDLPCAIIELDGEYIEQVYARFNTLPPLNVYKAITRWADAIGVKYDLNYLIIDNLFGQRINTKHAAELVEFVQSKEDEHLEHEWYGTGTMF